MMVLIGAAPANVGCGGSREQDAEVLHMTIARDRMPFSGKLIRRTQGPGMV